MGKLLIMFSVGAILCTIGLLWLLYMDKHAMMSNMLYLVGLISGGGVLMAISGNVALRKFGRYLDKD